MSILNENFILAADSYKVQHYSQIPAGVKWLQSCIVPRKPNRHTSKIVVAGTRYLGKYLESVTITLEDVAEAQRECAEQGYEFNLAGWLDIVNRFNGKLPLQVEALPEGTVVKPGTAIVLITNTDPEHAWLPSYVETVVQCIIWKFSTVASISKSLRDLLQSYSTFTGAKDGVDYKLHNFGDRGADSPEAAAFAGLSHAMLFNGSDSLKTNSNIKRLYGANRAYLSSVEATEHSTMCLNSNAATRDDYKAAVMCVERLEACVERASRGIGIPLMSVVIDTYDSHRFVRFLGQPELKERIIKSGGKLVLRPDSGDPLVEPITILNIAGEVFGYTINEEGYKVLPPYIGVLQGDGINQDSLPLILKNMCIAGWCLESLGFGMGGGLTHEAGRDEFSCSQKATAYSKAEHPSFDTWVDLKKEPITDLGKTSLSGYIVNVLQGKEIVSMSAKVWVAVDSGAGILVGDPIYRNGTALGNDSFDQVIERARA